MDKIKLTNHIKDIDLKNKMFKVIDKANSCLKPVSYTHLRAHETVLDLVCRLLLEKKKNTTT